MWHYLQSCSRRLSVLNENQKEGVTFIQRLNFVEENKEWRSWFAAPLHYPVNNERKPDDRVSLMPTLTSRLVYSRIIDHLIAKVKSNLNKMRCAPYSMSIHPSCQLVGERMMNTERTILHIAYFAGDQAYFQKVYKRLFRCDCFI